MEFNQTPNVCVDEVRNALLRKNTPQATKLANDKVVVETLTQQLLSVKNAYKSEISGATFATKQIISTVGISKAVKSPLAIGALVTKKFLITFDLISDSDRANCAVAVGILAADVTKTAALGSVTFGVGLLSGITILSSAYGSYNSCKNLF